MPDLSAIRIPGGQRAQWGKTKRRRALCRGQAVRRAPLQRCTAQWKLAVEPQFFDDIARETGLQLFKSHAAIPTDSCLVEYVGRKDVRFRHAEVLIASSAFVASIAAARTKEWKHVTDEVVVEI